jgi:hypothetical protein
MTRGHRGSVEIEIRRARRRRMPPLATFPEAPLRSRTVGFPESGSWPRLSTAFLRTGLPPRRETAVLAHPSPRRGGVCAVPSPRRRSRSSPAQRLAAYPSSWPPSAQSPFAQIGRYPRWGGLLAAWRSVTPSSSLIRAHAPDHLPPRASGSPLRAGSLQVVASPCCEMALPDIISAFLAWVLGPLPRRAPRLHASASSPRTPASPQTRRVRRAKFPPHGSFRGDIDFEAAVIRSPSGSHAC